MNVLFVGAHPGDIEVHAGGTAALYSRLGHKLFFVVCTEGYQNGKEVAKRYQETEKAADKIGASLVWMGFDSGFLVDRPASRMAFIESFRRAQPDVVICHAPYDSDPDHAISGQIVDDCIHMGCIPLIKTNHKECIVFLTCIIWTQLRAGVLSMNFMWTSREYFPLSVIWRLITLRKTLG